MVAKSNFSIQEENIFLDKTVVQNYARTYPSLTGRSMQMIEKSSHRTIAGQTVATDQKINELIPIYIIQQQSNRPHFNAYYLDLENFALNRTGEIEIYDFYGSYKDKRPVDYYGNTHQKIPYVFIDKISGNRFYHFGLNGVGSALMQVAIEYSLMRGYEGRIQLDAIWDSSLFYYHKIKMRVVGPLCFQIEERIEKACKKTLVEDVECEMYLPEEGISYWKNIIDQKPILNEFRESQFCNFKGV